MKKHFLGLRTVIYPAPELQKVRDWYIQAWMLLEISLELLKTHILCWPRRLATKFFCHELHEFSRIVMSTD
jgi:hypothetical protein